MMLKKMLLMLVAAGVVGMGYAADEVKAPAPKSEMRRGVARRELSPEMKAHQEKVAALVKSARGGDEKAKSELKEILSSQMDKEAAMLEKRAAEMTERAQKMKSDKDEMVAKRLDRMLGESKGGRKGKGNK